MEINCLRFSPPVSLKVREWELKEVIIKKMNKWDKFWLGFLVASWIGGVFILRSAYASSFEFPNGDGLGYFTIGLGEIFAPIWVPVITLGKLITLGL